MMKLHLVVVLAVFVTMSASAMIETLPLPKLVEVAELIVIAKVAEHAPPKDGSITTKLSVERALKGEWAPDKPLELLTADTKGQLVEDVVVLPEPGKRVVLFLAKDKDGVLRFVNGIQGVWPLEDKTDKTLGMGFRFSLAEIEGEVAGKKK